MRYDWLSVDKYSNFPRIFRIFGVGIMKRTKQYFLAAAIVILAVAAYFGIKTWHSLTSSYDGGDAWVYIPRDATEKSLEDSLRSALGTNYGGSVADVWKLAKGQAATAHGAYLIKNGDRVIDVARRLKRGAQTPVKITFNNIRFLSELSETVGRQMEFDAEDFMAACEKVLPEAGFKKEGFVAAFLPDTYEFYWTSGAEPTVKRLLDYRNKYWNDERRAKAKSLGLTPVQVATIASIVEEETAAESERPIVARLYLNRLKTGMKLQADPTVKFAVGDFGLRRILNRHLETVSPYNTYQIQGLPPGPIRMPSATTMSGVLDAPDHNYLYMCAKEDFSGRHNFATTLSAHNANASRYREALNKRGIK